MNFRNLIWLFPVAITLHNVEEAIWLPDWSKREGRWFAPVEPGVFRFAATVFAILAFAVTWLSARSGPQTIWTYLAFGCIVAALANVLFPHVALTVAWRGYMPGVVTALAINLPVLSVLVVLALRERDVSGWKAVGYCVGVGAAMPAAIRTLFKLGKILKF